MRALTFQECQKNHILKWLDLQSEKNELLKSQKFSCQRVRSDEQTDSKNGRKTRVPKFLLRLVVLAVHREIMTVSENQDSTWQLARPIRAIFLLKMLNSLRLCYRNQKRRFTRFVKNYFFATSKIVIDESPPIMKMVCWNINVIIVLSETLKNMFLVLQSETVRNMRCKATA